MQEPPLPPSSSGASDRNVESSSLAGRLLVATPATAGDVFTRSVVLLLGHDEGGAHGLVLNKPSNASPEAVLPGWETHLTEPRGLFVGGPVGLDTALGLVSAPGHEELLGIRRIFGSLAVVDLDAPPELIVPEIAGLRIFVGYSGWGPGQLEGEIKAGAWYVVPAEPRDPFSGAPDQLWQDVLRRQRGRLSWVARYPEDPTLN